MRSAEACGGAASVSSDDADDDQHTSLGRRAFDRGAAAGVISSVKLDVCEAVDGPRGSGHFTVTFTPDGASNALLDDWSLADSSDLASKIPSPFVGTPRGDCVAERLRTMAGIPPFDGGAVGVGKSFTLR